MTDQCLESGSLKNKTPTEAIPYLNNLLSENGDRFDLKPANLPWYTFKMNSAEQLNHKNLALLGDAAYSFHYSAGQGVTTSFSMAFTLVQCLLKNEDIEFSLLHYSHSIKLLLSEPARKSKSHMNWFEKIDHHFDNTNSEQWLDLFLQKDEFKENSQKKIKNCTYNTCR